MWYDKYTEMVILCLGPETPLSDRQLRVRRSTKRTLDDLDAEFALEDSKHDDVHEGKIRILP